MAAGWVIEKRLAKFLRSTWAQYHIHTYLHPLRNGTQVDRKNFLRRFSNTHPEAIAQNFYGHN
jgi:hypothetical protein